IATPQVPHTTKFRFKHKNGSWRLLEAVGKSVRDPDLGGTVLIITTRDITEHERTEIALGESETKFRAVIEGLGEGLIITDNDSRVSYFNTRMSTLTGYEPAELLGKPIFRYILPEHYWSSREQWVTSPEYYNSNHYEIELKRKDG